MCFHTSSFSLNIEIMQTRLILSIPQRGANIIFLFYGAVSSGLPPTPHSSLQQQFHLPISIILFTPCIPVYLP